MVLLCIGSRPSFDQYQKDFINEFLIEAYNVVHYDQDLSIASVRQIIHSLSFIQTNKLFIVTGSIRADSQNALLKSLEELQQGVHFLFWSENEDAFLDTIRSRSKIVRLSDKENSENNAYSLLKKNTSDRWALVDSLVEYIDGNGVSDIMPAVREHFVEAVNGSGQDVGFHYHICKKMLTTLPLMGRNNINSRVLIERVFEYESTS